ncbi:hypothetical protein T07_12683, partial [Trichinella nelsoni]
LETLLGWVVCGRTSPSGTAEAESFPTNPENSADMLPRKIGRSMKWRSPQKKTSRKRTRRLRRSASRPRPLAQRSVGSASRDAQV